MNNYSKYVISKIREYKCLDGHGTLKKVGIKNCEGNEIAYLIPITKGSDAEKPYWVKLLTEWRKANPTLSDNYFVPTEERTRIWLEKSIIGDDDKILFMINDVNGKELGHIGLCGFDYENRRVVVYSVLRGVPGVIGGLMEMSLRCLIDWSRSELGIEKYELTTSKTNERAIRLYEKVGFEIIETIPLKKVVYEDEIRWIPDASEDIGAERYRVRMAYRG